MHFPSCTANFCITEMPSFLSLPLAEWKVSSWVTSALVLSGPYPGPPPSPVACLVAQGKAEPSILCPRALSGELSGPSIYHQWNEVGTLVGLISVWFQLGCLVGPVALLSPITVNNARLAHGCRVFWACCWGSLNLRLPDPWWEQIPNCFLSTFAPNFWTWGQY